MDSANSNSPSGNAAASRVLTGVIMLIVGIVVGILVVRFFWPGTSFSRTANAAAVTTNTIAYAAPDPAWPDEAWNPTAQMSNMQTEIDQVFQRSLAEFRINPVADDLQPGYSLSMDVRDLPTKYQVRAFLPDTKAGDVNVKLVGNELKVDVANQSTEKEKAKSGETTMTEWGQYEEVVPLAGKLKPDEMKVQRKQHELIITVPKV